MNKLYQNDTVLREKQYKLRPSGTGKGVRISEVEIIILVKIHRILSGNVNCYIVANNGNAILIDTGRKKYREKIL